MDVQIHYRFLNRINCIMLAKNVHIIGKNKDFDNTIHPYNEYYPKLHFPLIYPKTIQLLKNENSNTKSIVP